MSVEMVTEQSPILERNLASLAKVDAAQAARIAQADEAVLSWSESKAGPLSAVMAHEDRQLSLASRFDPLAEAQRLVAQVDLAKHAGIFAIGLGLGYHIDIVARKLDDAAMLILFEPDLSLCKAVLSKIDYSHWLGKSNVVLCDSSVDMGTLIHRLEFHNGYITQGSVFVTHPVARQTHQDEVTRFGQLATDVMAYCRTNVATALVNSARTVENLTANLGYYIAGENTEPLKNAAKGTPAVCVAAGPSLARNIDLLRDENWRSKVIVIAVQTALKPLLDRGIKPDFVTALDYHAISRRFYEGIDALPDVTLVAEAKVHASVVDHFPGPVRIAANGFLSRFLTPHAPAITTIPSGATVAHLSVYLAQHLGCDPIILTGQDLGFSNGLYYCPGSAIHEVWANELGRFNTVEMMEWQRIMRHRNHLSKKTDVHGNTIYSDEQMLTYLKQFERDFRQATQTIINATQGGMPIAHTKNMTLLDALTQYATSPAPRLPLPSQSLSQEKLGVARKVTKQRIEEVRRIRGICQETIPLLEKIISNQRDQKQAQKLFVTLEENQKRIHAMDVTFALVNELNTIGTFKRNKADRAIAHSLANQNDPFARQKGQLERDIVNLQWLIQACDEALTLFGKGMDRLEQLIASTHATASAGASGGEVG